MANERLFTFYAEICKKYRWNIPTIRPLPSLSPPHPQLSFSASKFFGACHVGGGYVIPSDDAQPARLDAVLATSRAFGNFRFKDPAQTPGDNGHFGQVGDTRFLKIFFRYVNELDAGMQWCMCYSKKAV